jgi:tetratricopeptide (TPR) repeat protein
MDVIYFKRFSMDVIYFKRFSMDVIYSKSRQLIICCLLVSTCVIGFAQNQVVTVKEYQQVFTTYPFSDPNPIPVSTSIYPYFRYDGFTDKPIQKSWKVVELENNYIKVLILPEVGGKIWTAIEKSTNQPFIYYNHAVKFRNLGMRGPYTSGGLEYNFGIFGHTPNCATPVDYIIQNNADGSVSCIVGVLDLLTQSNWRLEIKLEKDKACFSTRTFWYSSTPIGQPYYHWLNGGYKASGNLEFIFPGTHYIWHDGEYYDWPVNKSNGKNLSFYESNNFGRNKSYHVVGKYANFSGGYWHDDDFGMVRYGAHDDKAGKKIWIWGLSRQGQIWEKLLTDTDGQYVEMQSGRLFNQNIPAATYTPFKHMYFAPYATDIWTECFYPVLRTKGYVEANEYGALNVKNEGERLKIFFSPAQAIDDLLEVTANKKVIYSRKLKLTPLKTFADSIEYTSNGDNLTITLGGNKLIYLSDPNANVLSRPVVAPSDFDWTSAYGLYIQGKEAIDQKMYPLAEENLKAALEKDHNYLPALLKLAELYYRNMQYSQALELATKALSIDTHDGGANYFYGLVNTRLGNSTDAKDGFDLATLSVEYRSAAYTELSRIYFREKNFEKALGYAERAVDYNRYNIEALQLQAVICRNQRAFAKANEILKTILSFDPLNHFSRFEKHLANPDENSKIQFTSLIRNELPQETYMELAVWYYTLGCLPEAEKVLTLSPQTPETIYWLSFLHHEKVKCAEINPDFSFPFRSETALVLEQLLTQQDDWLLKYQLALVYMDRNRKNESANLLVSCGNKPDFAPFYACRAKVYQGKNDSLCEIDLKRALSLDSQWRYQKLLADFYNDQLEYDKALAITDAFYRSNPGHFIMGPFHAKNLLLNKKYKEADVLLTKINILPSEGATEGHELYREAKLMQAAQMMHKKNYKAAGKFIAESRLWPENLGVGKPYSEDIDMRLEDWMDYVCLIQLKKTKEADEMLNRIIQFEPQMIDNTVMNFLPANALATAWAFEQLNRKDEAIPWLNKQIEAFPGSTLLMWSKAMYEQRSDFVLHKNQKDANVRIIEQLINPE